MLNATDLAKMAAHEVASLADIDAHSVRNEGLRRQEIAEKKMAKLIRQIEAAKAEMAAAQQIINAAFRELAA